MPRNRACASCTFGRVASARYVGMCATSVSATDSFRCSISLARELRAAAYASCCATYVSCCAMTRAWNCVGDAAQTLTHSHLQIRARHADMLSPTPLLVYLVNTSQHLTLTLHVLFTALINPSEDCLTAQGYQAVPTVSPNPV
jgi:hypothetical protein